MPKMNRTVTMATQVEVLEPVALREEIMRIAQAVASLYAKPAKRGSTQDVRVEGVMGTVDIVESGGLEND